MRDLREYGFAAMVCLFLAAVLQARTATGQEKLAGLDGRTGRVSNGSRGAEMERVYAGPYRAAVRVTSASSNAPLRPPFGATGFGPARNVYCVEYAHGPLIGATKNVYLTNVGDAPEHGGLTSNRTGSSSLAQYLQIAPTYSKLPNAALWRAMSVGDLSCGSSSSTGSEVPTTLIDASKPHAGIDAAEGVFVTCRNFTTGGTQEYIAHLTPEPAMLLLLGTSLVVALMASGAFRQSTA